MQKRYILTARHIRDDQDNEVMQTNDFDALLDRLKIELADDPHCDWQFTITSDFAPVEG